MLVFGALVLPASAAKPEISCSVSPNVITLGQSVEATAASTRLPYTVSMIIEGQTTDYSFGPFSTSPVVVSWQPPYAGDWRVHVISWAKGGGKIPLQTQCSFTVLP